MKNRELIEYLQGFDADSDISIILGNLEARQLYEVTRHMVITDVDHPVIMFEIEAAGSMDDLNKER
jgi:hypothetical protein